MEPSKSGSVTGSVRAGRLRSICESGPNCASRVKASVEHALLAIGMIFRLAQSDEVAEHEIVIGADAGSRSDDVAGSFSEIEPGVTIGVVTQLRMAPHADLPAGVKLRVGEQAGHAHHRISRDAVRLQGDSGGLGAPLPRPGRDDGIERLAVRSPRRRRRKARLTGKVAIADRSRERRE